MRPDSYKVLIVDDNLDCADSAALMLQIAGFTTRTAYRAEEAIRLAKTFRPHLALVDIGMPDKDGYHLGPELMALCPGCRIIALTGFSQAESVRRSTECGFVAHLVKPVDPKELLRIVQANCESS